MKLKTFKITDTVTYSRSWTVKARTKDEAIDKAINEGPGANFEQEQIDNTPYEAEPNITAKRVK